MNAARPARVLIIAGSDSGGGAGIQADIKTISALGGHAMTAITAVTAQNTIGVQAVHPVPADIVLEQIKSCVADIGVDAVKIGMIGSAETATAVAEQLAVLKVPIIFDPVMAATSGGALADGPTISAFEKLMKLAILVTPNLPELAALGGEGAVLAHGCSLLVKGGHGADDELIDRLVNGNGGEHLWRNERIDSLNTHGTGCTLASAIALGLAQKLSLEAAIERGIKFVRAAIISAPDLGQGSGPMGQQFVDKDAR